MPLHNRRTSDIVVDRTERTPAESFRTDSHPSVAALDGIRAVSHRVRIDAKHTFLQVINEVRTRLSLSVEAMAINAECSTSSMSDALAGKDGRNFAGHWLLAQGDDFLALFNQLVDERRGLTPATKRANRARRLSELFREVFEELA